VGVFPQFELLAQYLPQYEATAKHFPQPDPGRQYPLVGLIDTGTDPNNPLLQAWVTSRDEEDVPRADQDNNHGSFVAGLIINARNLNHGDTRFPVSQSRIVDVVGMPKPGTTVTESDLLQTIRRAVRKYPDVRVWNLSVSRKDTICRDDGFSLTPAWRHGVGHYGRINGSRRSRQHSRTTRGAVPVLPPWPGGGLLA
jgi:subtilisin family serine protease